MMATVHAAIIGLTVGGCVAVALTARPAMALTAASTIASNEHSAQAQALPIPPVPPASPPPGDNAPVPDLQAQAPASVAPETPRFDVRLYRSKPYEPGLGFAPGSRYQDSEDRKPIQTPGISISVPLN
jgi:hypothetical protein